MSKKPASKRPTRRAARKSPAHDVLGDALRYAGLGWRLIPTYATGPKAKRPRIREWPTLASTATRHIENWYGTYSGEPGGCAFGLACGAASGVFVVDVDTRDDGLGRWEELVKKNGDLPAGPVGRPGGGGLHLYYAWPDGEAIANSAGTVAPGVDVRAEGGFVVLPPSPHPKGTTYAWGVAPWDAPLPMPPAWLLKLVKRANKPRDWKSLEVVWEPGTQEAHIYHWAHEFGMTGQPLELITEVLVSKLGKGEIPSEEGKEAWTEEQVREKVERGWGDGKTAREATLQGIVMPPEVPEGPNGGLGSNIPARYSNPLGLTDQDNAIRFGRMHVGKVVYATGVGWLVWEGTHWRPDPEEITIKRLARDVGNRIINESMNVGGQQRGKLLAWAQQSLNIGKTHAMITLAKGYLEVGADELDADPWLLNFGNGTVDLRTGELRAHVPGDLITKVVNCAYNPRAKAPTWEQTVKLALGDDKESMKFFHRMMGYSLTGVLDEQSMFICWGPEGTNGKSTLMEGFRRAFDDYAGNADAKVLMSDWGGTAGQSSLAGLRGARFVVLSETGDTMRLDSTILKQMTGGDTVMARALYQNVISFVPNFKLWVLTNDLPRVGDMGQATWRRIRPIPFNHQIPKEVRRDRSLVDPELDAQQEGIMAWAVRGCLDWQQHRGELPKAVESARSEYMADQDIIRQYFAEKCEFGKGDEFKEKHSDLYSSFSSFCYESGHRGVMTMSSFVRRLRKMPEVKVADIRSSGVWWVLGIKKRFDIMS